MWHPGTSPRAMVVVKKEDFVDEEVIESGVDLSFVSKKAYRMLKPALKPVCLVYNLPFHGLLEAM